MDSSAFQNRYISQFTQPPDVSKFFEKKFWAIHEAAFMFTEWPKNGCDILYEDTRPVIGLKIWCKFFLPQGKETFDPSQYGAKFKNIYSMMKKAAEQGILEATFAFLHDGITWIVEPKRLIFWALSNGIFIPEELQNEIGVFLFDNPKNSKNWVEKKIIAQILLIEDPTCETNKLKNDPLFSFFGIKSVDDNRTAIGKAIESVRKNPGKKGVKKRAPYIPEALPEVRQIDLNGNVRFHLPSLMNVLTIMFWAWIYRLGQDHIESGALSCLKIECPISHWYLTSDMPKLYLSDASPLLIFVALEHCGNVWEGIKVYCSEL